MTPLVGFPRRAGRPGARDRTLVLPSVMCAQQVSEQIAGTSDAITIRHQHGCGEIGDDVEQTRNVFLGLATNPNVGSVLVVSLGCETVQGRELADAARRRGQNSEVVGIQALGGTAAAVERGVVAVRDLRRQASRDREPTAPSELAVGIETGDATPAELVAACAAALARRGATVQVAFRDGGPADGPLAASPRVGYGEAPASAGGPTGRGQVVVMARSGVGVEQQAALAAAGCQVIVSLRDPGRAAVGLAGYPVLAVAGDRRTHEALRDDFDLVAPDPGDPAATDGFVERLLADVVAVFNGRQTAAERRSSRDFGMRRTAVSL